MIFVFYNAKMITIPFFKAKWKSCDYQQLKPLKAKEGCATKQLW